MAYAILVHVILGGVLFVSLEWTDVPTPAQPKVDIVKAVAVDESRILAELEKLKKAEAKKEKKEKVKQQQLDKQAREAKKKRQREEKRLAKLRKEREAEKKRQKKLQKERKAEEKRIAAERAAKQKEVERLKTEQATLEQKRIAEEKRLADIAAKRKQLEEKRRRDAEAAARRAEMVAEQQRLEAANQKRLSSLRGAYIADIQNAVERNWIRPASAKQGLKCKVVVNQIPGGEVINVTVTQCIGDDIFRRSVETAVYKASPLPRPSDPALFDREIVFTFKPKK
jgi:colicin import membrane protein